MVSQSSPWTSKRARSFGASSETRWTACPSTRWKVVRSAGWRAMSRRTASNIKSGSRATFTSTAPPMLYAYPSGLRCLRNQSAFWFCVSGYSRSSVWSSTASAATLPSAEARAARPSWSWAASSPAGVPLSRATTGSATPSSAWTRARSSMARRESSPRSPRPVAGSMRSAPVRSTAAESAANRSATRVRRASSPAARNVSRKPCIRDRTRGGGDGYQARKTGQSTTVATTSWAWSWPMTRSRTAMPASGESELIPRLCR